MAKAATNSINVDYQNENKEEDNGYVVERASDVDADSGQEGGMCPTVRQP